MEKGCCRDYVSSLRRLRQRAQGLVEREGRLLHVKICIYLLLGTFISHARRLRAGGTRLTSEPGSVVGPKRFDVMSTVLGQAAPLPYALRPPSRIKGRAIALSGAGGVMRIVPQNAAAD